MYYKLIFISKAIVTIGFLALLFAGCQSEAEYIQDRMWKFGDGQCWIGDDIDFGSERYEIEENRIFYSEDSNTYEYYLSEEYLVIKCSDNSEGYYVEF